MFNVIVWSIYVDSWRIVLHIQVISKLPLNKLRNSFSLFIWETKDEMFRWIVDKLVWWIWILLRLWTTTYSHLTGFPDSTSIYLCCLKLLIKSLVCRFVFLVTWVVVDAFYVFKNFLKLFVAHLKKRISDKQIEQYQGEQPDFIFSYFLWGAYGVTQYQNTNGFLKILLYCSVFFQNTDTISYHVDSP